MVICMTLPNTNAVTIMSIDFGSEWMKIAVVAVSDRYDSCVKLIYLPIGYVFKVRETISEMNKFFEVFRHSFFIWKICFSK